MLGKVILLIIFVYSIELLCAKADRTKWTLKPEVVPIKKKTRSGFETPPPPPAQIKTKPNR